MIKSSKRKKENALFTDLKSWIKERYKPLPSFPQEVDGSFFFIEGSWYGPIDTLAIPERLKDMLVDRSSIKGKESFSNEELPQDSSTAESVS